MQLLYPFLRVIMNFRQGSNERDSSSPTERVSSVILSEAKDLSAERDRPFASLRVTRWDGCNCERLFFTTEPCLKSISGLFCSFGDKISPVEYLENLQPFQQ